MRQFSCKEDLSLVTVHPGVKSKLGKKEEAPIQSFTGHCDFERFRSQTSHRTC